jgi:hypothetical protein
MAAAGRVERRKRRGRSRHARVGERLPGHARTGRASLSAAVCSELVEQSHAVAGGQTQRRDCELFRLLCRRVERRKQRKEHAETTSHPRI